MPSDRSDWCSTSSAPGMICARGGIGCPKVHDGVTAFTSVKTYSHWRTETDRRNAYWSIHDAESRKEAS